MLSRIYLRLGSRESRNDYSKSRYARLIDVPRPPLVNNASVRWCTNINALSIDYGFRPRLRPRLTLGGIAFPRKPLGFRRMSFSLLLSLLMPGFSLVHTVQAVLTVTLQPVQWYAPLPLSSSAVRLS